LFKLGLTLFKKGLGLFSLQAGLHAKGRSDSREDSNQDLQDFVPNSFFHSCLGLKRVNRF
jgi:hypothetical protein